MTFFKFLIMGLILYLCLYALVDRLCQCIEHCAIARVYGNLRNTDVMTTVEDIRTTIKGQEKE